MTATTREFEKQTNETTMWLAILISLLITSFICIFLYLLIMENINLQDKFYTYSFDDKCKVVQCDCSNSLSGTPKCSVCVECPSKNNVDIGS